VSAVTGTPSTWSPRVLARSIAILWALTRFALPLVLGAFRDRLASRGWLRASAARATPEAYDAWLHRHGGRLRDALVRLGPTFIKVGQMLATRADLVPVAFLRELQTLHDRVPAFPDRQAFAIVEGALGRPIGAVFSEISDGPIAAASLGQVYRARLRSDGRVVAVKVRRPALAGRVAVDLAVLGRIAGWAEALAGRRDLLDHLKWLRGEWVGSVHEFERVLAEEMNYRLEGQNAARFKANFAGWSDIYVPEVLHEFTTERLLVMDFVEGIKVTDLDGLRRAGFDPRAVNERLYRTYFKQLFEDGFFHADPHPGNLLVMRDGRLAFFDFGMVGVVDDELRGKIVAAFFHMLDRDVDGLVGDLIALDFLAPDADVTGLHEVVGEVMQRRLSVKLSEVNFQEIVYDLAPVVYEYPLTTPARFTFLIRALMTLEGISVEMNPDFNFFQVAGPYARDFLMRQDAASLRRQISDGLRDARSGKIDWGRVWRMAKAAYTVYVGQ
jgi:predicted unusual protein kinase regulating ubiquinone biosynthesis (AarF/ABC1/UbiB family)